MLIQAVIGLTIAAPSLPGHGEGRYAVVVSVNRPMDAHVEPLRYADDDGLRYLEVLGLLDVEVWLLAEMDADTARFAPAVRVQSPTRDALARTMSVVNGRLAADHRRGKPTHLYFIYTGHGSIDEDGEGYLSLANARLRRSDLMESILGPSQADTKHVIIDACRSYLMVRSRGENGWREDRLDADMSGVVERYRTQHERDAFANTGLLLSTSSDRKSHEWEAYGAGVFSHQLRSGLLGAADVNGDGAIEYVELEAYIAAANDGVTDAQAKLVPYVKAPGSSPSGVLITLPAGARHVVFEQNTAGHIHLDDERGVRYADFHKASNAKVRLVLPPSRAFWLRSATGEMALPRTGNVALASLTLKPLDRPTRDGLADAFRLQLYRVPFGSAYYKGFLAAKKRAYPP